MLYYLLKIYHMIPNFLNHVSNIWHHFQHNTRSRKIWMEKKIAFNQILSEKKKSVSLPLLHHWRWFPRMIVLLIFLYWQTEFCFVHTYINSPETTSWYHHHHHKKMTRCQVSTFKSVKKNMILTMLSWINLYVDFHVFGARRGQKVPRSSWELKKDLLV